MAARVLQVERVLDEREAVLLQARLLELFELWLVELRLVADVVAAGLDELREPEADVQSEMRSSIRGREGGCGAYTMAQPTSQVFGTSCPASQFCAEQEAFVCQRMGRPANV